MKVTFFSALACIIFFQADAQTNFHRFAAGAGYGLTGSKTDLPKSENGYAFYATLDYYLKPMLSIGAEYQNGNIKGSGSESDSRYFTNSYASGAMTISVHFNGWLYAGAGAGVIHNTMVNIQRTQANGNSAYQGNDVSNDLWVPVNVGATFYFRDYSGVPKFGVNVNLQYSTTLGEGLDGYDESFTTFTNGTPDNYTYFSVGLKYNFGGLGITSRRRN